MKFLYYSDRYTWENFGTKRSIFLELINQGQKVVWKNLGKISNIIRDVEKIQPDGIFLAHSGLTITKMQKQIINEKNIKVIGIGMSDPYYFDNSRLKSYDLYITNNWYIYKKYRNKIHCHYNMTACDFRFHKYIVNIKKKYPLSLIGVASHPRFTNCLERLEIVEKIRENGLKIHTFGNGWEGNKKTNHRHIKGRKFRKILQTTVLGLDIQDENSPLAHRMFEYSGCGTPIITRRRQEASACFKENEEILMYDCREELLDKIKFYYKKEQLLRKIGEKAYNRCRSEHNISFRVEKMLNFIYSKI